LFINEFDEFKLNECLCIVWCSINVCERCGVWSRLPVLLYPDSTSHWNHRWRWLSGESRRRFNLDTISHWNHRWIWLDGGSRRRFIWLGHGVKKNQLDQIIWINRFTWLCYGVKKNWSNQIMWVKGFIWPRYGVKKNRLDRIICIKFIWLRYGVKKNRLDYIIWIKFI